MFLHASWLHLIGNMWFLWIFGDNIEDYLGHFSYLLFYLVCGFAAAITHILLNAGSEVAQRGGERRDCRGNGALYFVLYPKARVMMWFPAYIFLSSSGVAGAGILVSHAIPQRSSDLDCRDKPDQWRDRVLGTRGRICGWGCADQSVAGAATALSLCGLVNYFPWSFARLHGRDAALNGLDAAPAQSPDIIFLWIHFQFGRLRQRISLPVGVRSAFSVSKALVAKARLLRVKKRL